MTFINYVAQAFKEMFGDMISLITNGAFSAFWFIVAAISGILLYLFRNSRRYIVCFILEEAACFALIFGSVTFVLWCIKRLLL